MRGQIEIAKTISDFWCRWNMGRGPRNLFGAEFREVSRILSKCNYNHGMSQDFMSSQDIPESQEAGETQGFPNFCPRIRNSAQDGPESSRNTMSFMKIMGCHRIPCPAPGRQLQLFDYAHKPRQTVARRFAVSARPNSAKSAKKHGWPGAKIMHS